MCESLALLHRDVGAKLVEYDVMMNTMTPDLSSLIKVRLRTPEDFLIIAETLTRIGIPSKVDNILYQSCHILCKKKVDYYIVHFKELFWLDGRADRLSDIDRARRNTIANMFANWGMIELVDPSKSSSPIVPAETITILPYAEKHNWSLQPKYELGRKTRR